MTSEDSHSQELPSVSIFVNPYNFSFVSSSTTIAPETHFQSVPVSVSSPHFFSHIHPSDKREKSNYLRESQNRAIYLSSTTRSNNTRNELIPNLKREWERNSEPSPRMKYPSFIFEE